MNNLEFAKYLRSMAADLDDAGSTATAQDLRAAAETIEKQARHITQIRAFIAGVHNNIDLFLQAENESEES